MKIQINCSSSIASFFFLVLIFSSPLFFYDGLAAPDNKTDPIEVDALNAIFRNWNIPFTGSRTYVGVNSSTGGIIIRTVDWNISSTSPCTRFVVDNSEDERISITSHGKPDILCLCSQQTSLCNIIKLSLWGFNVTGMIPNALQNLTKLQILDLHENSLGGELPTFLWTLSEMKYMYLSKNNFNGSLPPQIGNLKNIQILYLSSNNFNGSLPSEIGNLEKMRIMGLSNNNFGGKIPNSLWNLINLEILDLSSNNFNGSLPSEIGNLEKMRIMGLSYNNFGGKIPNSLWNLINLEILDLSSNNFNGSLPSEIGNLEKMRIIYLYGNNFIGSLPSEIGNMKNLQVLYLSRNQFEGEIPNFLGNLTKLRRLYLGFNNLSGDLPNSIFNIPTLEIMYLNNNNFNGGLPNKKSDKLIIIDISSNNLQGKIPQWNDVSMNLVNNQFSAQDIEKIQPQGLECLQKTSKCSAGKDLFTSFAINCGGERIVSSDEIIFEADNNNNASYYITDNNRWAAVTFRNRYHAIITSTKSITDTSDPKLYLSARKSTTALKYYGLGLKTGNYNVDLMFANIDDDDTYAFDIYIQGLLKIKNFQIGVMNNKASILSYTIPVTENTKMIEISLIPKFNSKVLISAINVTPDFKVATSTEEGGMKRSTKIGILVGLSIFIVILCVIGYRLWARKSSTNY